MATVLGVIGSWIGLSVVFALLVGRAMAVARSADPEEAREAVAAGRCRLPKHAAAYPALAHPRRAKLGA